MFLKGEAVREDREGAFPPHAWFSMSLIGSPVAFTTSGWQISQAKGWRIERHLTMPGHATWSGGMTSISGMASFTDAFPRAKARGFSLAVVRTLTILRWSLVRDLQNF